VERTGNSIGGRAWSAVLLAAFLSLCVLILGAPAASASFPAYNGGSFPTIHSPSDPEEFSWEVKLGAWQELRYIDEHDVGVYYSNGQLAIDIKAGPASDAVGATVPTTIDLTGENVVTLIVHHREGNPAAGGAPFVYPVVSGAGWEGGFHTEIVHIESSAPPLEAQPPSCVVPRLKGSTLKGARKLLVGANCSIAAIGKAKGGSMATGRVVRQAPKPGWTLAPGSGVNIRLG
jgi:hypothetical protein